VLLLLILVLAGIALISCSRILRGPLSYRDLGLQGTHALVIEYRLGKATKKMEIVDPDEVSRVLALISINEIQTNDLPKSYCFGRVRFLNEQSETIGVYGFYEPDTLYETDSKLVHLKDDRFYQEISARASRIEGRPIDPLIRNEGVAKPVSKRE
jgi:hypothetical protein